MAKTNIDDSGGDPKENSEVIAPADRDRRGKSESKPQRFKWWLSIAGGLKDGFEASGGAELSNGKHGDLWVRLGVVTVAVLLAIPLAAVAVTYLIQLIRSLSGGG